MTLENIFQAHSSSCWVILTVLTIDDLIHWLCKYWLNGLYASTGCPDLLLDVSFPSWKNKETLWTDHSQSNLYSTPDLNVKTRFLHSPCFCLLCEPFPISCRTIFHDKPWQFFKKLAGFSYYRIPLFEGWEINVLKHRYSTNLGDSCMCSMFGSCN